MKIAVLQASDTGFFPSFFATLTSRLSDASSSAMCFSPDSGQNRRRQMDNRQLFGYRWNWFTHYNLYRLTGIQDLWSFASTRDLISKLDSFGPDLVHLNVIGEWILCMPMLIKYLNGRKIPVVWTFHDARAFTARCPFFDEIHCEKWKSGCKGCPKDGSYEKSLINATSLQWKLKKKWFSRFENLTIVTPSKWLADLVSSSFLGSYPVKVINNGIDVDFYHTKRECTSEKVNALSGKIILGVASTWEPRKGLEHFFRLAANLPDDCHIVLVGGYTDDQAKNAPDNVIFLPRTATREDLAAIYQKADVFVNPTLADNFPTVNLEALASGTPVVTFQTGGSGESIDPTCGAVVPQGDDKALLDAVMDVLGSPEKFSRQNCITRSKMYSQDQFDNYVRLFEEILKK